MPFRVTAAFVLISLFSCQALFADPSFTRVRTPSADLRALIDEGATRSDTLRNVLARLERGQWVVFIFPGQCPDQQLVACLTHTVGDYDGYRSLRILVDVGRQHYDGVLASVAHELMHALEVVDAPEVIDAVTMRDFFRRIGRESVSSHRVTAYETSTAVTIGETVRHELQRASSPTR
jgi:hypothetical protein